MVFLAVRIFQFLFISKISLPAVPIGAAGEKFMNFRFSKNFHSFSYEFLFENELIWKKEKFQRFLPYLHKFFVFPYCPLFPIPSGVSIVPYTPCRRAWGFPHTLPLKQGPAYYNSRAPKARTKILHCICRFWVPFCGKIKTFFAPAASIALQNSRMIMATNVYIMEL